MGQATTRLERIVTRIKRNLVVASMIFVGAGVVAVWAFFDAAQNLTGLVCKWVRGPTIVDLSGEWVSDPFGDKEQLSFTFDVRGDTLFGKVSSSNSNDTNGIKGTIKDNIISFDVPKTFWRQGVQSITPGERPTIGITEESYKISYSGTVGSNKIDFVRQDSRGSPPDKFVARRKRER